VYEGLCGGREGRWAFRQHGGWGLLDADCKVVVRPFYEEVSGFRDGLCRVVRSSGETAYIDRYGSVRIELPDAKCEGGNFCEGLARVLYWFPGTRDLYGYISTEGRIAIEPRFGSAGDFSEGLAPVSMTQDGWFNLEGTELIGGWSPAPDLPEPPPAWGFINRKGEVVIPLIYEKALYFSEGLAAVKQGGKWGYIDRTGRMVIGAGFENAYGFRNGIAKVVIGERVVYIDKTGRILVRTDMCGLEF